MPAGGLRGNNLLRMTIQGEVMYKQYLVMRRDKPKEALEALRRSVRTFEQVEGMEADTLKEMQSELNNFAKALEPAIRQEREAKVEVTLVQPRKRVKRET